MTSAHVERLARLAATEDGKAFLLQNDRVSEGLTDEHVEQVDAFAEHHAGGLYVLIDDLGGGWYVKMHDSWGDEELIVVHLYNVNDDRSADWLFEDAPQALYAFLNVTPGWFEGES